MKKDPSPSSALRRKLAFFLFLSISLAISWVVSPLVGTPAHASGIVHTKVGDTVEISATDTGGFEYSWVLKQGDQIIPQQVITPDDNNSSFLSSSSPGQSPQNTSQRRTFRHTFSEEGQFEINLIRTNTTTGQVQNTSVSVLVGLEDPNFAPQNAIITTLPKASTDQKVYLSGESAEVIFFSASSTGKPFEYHIDTDIGVDSDGDGISDNDIDNANHPSFFTGQSWSHVYSADQVPAIAQLTAKYPTGEEKTDTIEILFYDTQLLQRDEKPLQAVLETIPPSNENGQIFLSGQSAKVTFFSGNSEGNIAEYRIDKNIQFDTNGDGNSENDIDNAGTPSVRTGAPWETNFEKEWGDIVVELLVVQEGGASGSRLRRQIVFGDPPPSDSQYPNATPTSFQKLIVSTPQAFVGENITFTVLGLPPGAKTAWDFDGDGILEYEGLKTENIFRYNFAGEFPVSIEAFQNDQSIARFQQQISISAQDENTTITNPPQAEFIFSGQDNVISFSNTSSADERLLNTDLVYSWDFGDDTASDEQNPTHTFPEAKTYTVVLTATDSVGRSSTTAQNITIANVVTPAQTPDTNTPPPQNTPDTPEPNTETPPAPSGPQSPSNSTETPNAPDESGIGWIWIVVIILFTPVVLIGLYVVVRKIQMPDLSFEEIIAEDLEKFRGKKEFASPEPSIQTTPPPSPTTDAQDEAVAPEVVPDPETNENSENETDPPLATPDTQAPDWLKTDDEEITPQPPQESDDTPDWLKTDEQIDTNPNTQQDPSSQNDETPDWLKADVIDPTPSEQTPAETPPQDTTKSEDIPDWLKADDEEITPQDPQTQENDDTPDWLKTDEAIDTTPNTQQDPPSQNDETPDWLKADDTDQTTETTEETPKNNESPDWLTQDIAPDTNTSPSPQAVPPNTPPEQPTSAPQTPTPDPSADIFDNIADDSDIPDWLKDNN